MAAGICLGVVHPDIVSFAGVAPIMVYDARRRAVTTISGLGVWPARASLEFFRDHCGGDMPEGLLRTVVPAAPDAWITALERFGTLGFAEVAQPAIECARDGFPLGPFVARIIGDNEAAYRRWPTSAPIFLPGGQAPRAGQRFVQADLGRTLTYLADEDRAGPRAGRAAGLAAARDAFYRGDVAATIARYHAAEGGLLTRGRPRRLPRRRRAARAGHVRIARGGDLRLLVPGSGAPPDAPDPSRDRPRRSSGTTRRTTSTRSRRR